jgi:hypothetical protein
MAKTNHAEFNRLLVQIERDLVAQANLRALLTEAGTTVATHRSELQTIKGRIDRLRRDAGKR